jgi:ribosomal protein S18 acetylase RimI-like enzyme
MHNHLARAYAFLARGEMAGERREPSSVGTAVFDDAVPKRLDSNFLRVERDAAPEAVLEEARRLGRRMIHVEDTEIGERLAPFFAQRRWLVRRHAVMAQLRDPEPRRNGDLRLVEEVDEETLRPARHQVVTGQPWGTPEVMAQLFAGKQLIARRVQTRFLALKVDGRVASYTDLYQEGADAQIEDVGTVHEHRCRGFASTVVLAAIDIARRDGAEFVFLVADRDDWPKELYRRLGFDELGYYVKLIAPHT